MTFKELLDCVRFEDVASHIVRMYPGMGQSLGWYKIHFDMLRLMQPVFREDAYDEVCHINMEDWEDGRGLHLDAYPMTYLLFFLRLISQDGRGLLLDANPTVDDFWKHSLTKELIIAQDVKTTNEELAACCLWHTSFYGYVEKHVKERFDRWEDCLYYKASALQNFSLIREHGGFIPTISQLSKSKKAELIKQAKDSVLFGSTPMNRIKRKMHFRAEFLKHYYERMTVISDFIVHAIPALKDARNYMRVEQLCELFHSDQFCTEEIMSFASDGESGAKYLYDLLTSYDMIPKMDGIVVRLVIGTEHEVLTEDENLLCNLLAEGRKYGDLILDYDPALGNQVVISYAAYNSNNPLVI